MGGNLVWLAWPGGPVDQEDDQGWAFIGEARVPEADSQFVVTLNNADPADPGWDAYAGAMAVQFSPA